MNPLDAFNHFARWAPYQQTEAVGESPNMDLGYLLVQNPTASAPPYGPFTKPPIPPGMTGHGTSPSVGGTQPMPVTPKPGGGWGIGNLPNPIPDIGTGLANAGLTTGKALLWYAFFLTAFLLLGYTIVTGSANPVPAVTRIVKTVASKKPG